MDRDHEQPAESYWQHYEDGLFTLWHEGREAAVIDPANEEMTLHHEDGFTTEIKVPTYVCLFDEAERQLGLRRIEEVHGVDCTPDPQLRRSAELDAELAAETRTPDQWARAYAARALFLLNRDSADRELSGEENRAGYHLAHAVAAMDGQATDAQLDVRGHLEQASALLADGKKDGRHGNASLVCDKALAVLEYEDARQAVRESPEEEALRHDGFLPRDNEAAAERSDEADSDWRFEPSRGVRESEIERDRETGDAGYER